MLTVTLEGMDAQFLTVAWADVVSVHADGVQEVWVTIVHDGCEPTKIQVISDFDELCAQWDTYLSAVFVAQFPEADV